MYEVRLAVEVDRFRSDWVGAQFVIDTLDDGRRLLRILRCRGCAENFAPLEKERGSEVRAWIRDGH